MDRQANPATAETVKIWLRVPLTLRPFSIFCRPIQKFDAILRVSRVLMGAETVPYLPKMYSAKEPPKQVCICILLHCNFILSDTNSSVNLVAAGYECI
jgi:hypothetical protein